ncbi:cation:proton antiporter [Saccharopolyspora sp. 5N102]|uniref:cation:proton antiporter domain-containing protein n=1 Tax=Saccharopolyspora sp. 5N102 TaxID=3375155 RepID=UPI0037A73226
MHTALDQAKRPSWPVAGAPALLPVLLALFFVIRGLPIIALQRRDLPKRPKWTLALLGSAALPMVVVITTIGTEVGAMPPSTASALVGAAMISVLVFPMLGLRISQSAALAKSDA